MSQSDLDIRFGGNARAAVKSIEAVERSLRVLGLWRAIHVAWHNNYKPIRFVVGRRLGRRLGIIRGEDVKLYGLPVVVDETAEDGFGLVTRPPSP